MEVATKVLIIVGLGYVIWHMSSIMAYLFIILAFATLVSLWPIL